MLWWSRRINATIGVAICFCSNQQKRLKKIQNELFDIGADLCMPQKKKYESISKGVINLEER